MPSRFARLGVLLTAPALTALAYAVVTLIVRTRPLTNLPALVVVVGSPYVLPPIRYPE
jgi:hypothetical protein